MNYKSGKAVRGRLAIGIATLLFMAGCTRPADSSAAAAPGTNTAASAGTDASQTRSPSCRLLTDDEVTAAIGPHSPGTSDLSTTWGQHGCRWQSRTVQKISGYGDWSDAVEVGVFESSDDWARRQMTGEPVSGFVDNAKYDVSYGQLWFGCAGGRTCVVEAKTASGKKRKEIALQLAQLVNQRVK